MPAVAQRHDRKRKHTLTATTTARHSSFAGGGQRTCTTPAWSRTHRGVVQAHQGAQHLDTKHQSAQPHEKARGNILERDRTRHQCSTLGKGGGRVGETHARARRSHREAQTKLRQRRLGCEAHAQGRARRRPRKNAGAIGLFHGCPPRIALRGSQ